MSKRDIISSDIIRIHFTYTWVCAAEQGQKGIFVYEKGLCMYEK